MSCVSTKKHDDSNMANDVLQMKVTPLGKFK